MIVAFVAYVEIPGFWYDQEKNRYYRIPRNSLLSPPSVPKTSKNKDQLEAKSNGRKKKTPPSHSSNVVVNIEMAHSLLVEKLHCPGNNGGVDMTKLLILREYQHLGLMQSKR